LQLLTRISIMLEKSHKCHTGTHARIDKWGRATKNELKMWRPRKMLLLHNTRETLADCSNGRDIKLVHNLYEAKRYDFLSQVCYMYVFR
jgi:hypothetical protein